MTGPVDFNQSVDYWQQDKWSGRFPVKWHIVKDVPNNQLRHIILENNDNKPVTNSRDTQEVMLDKGVEMLKIFKDYVSKTSILDDFIFYEGRQKAMQEKRARQQVQQQRQGSQFRPGSEFNKLHPEESALKAQDGRTGEASVEDKDVKSRPQQSADLTSAATSTTDKNNQEDGQNSQDNLSSSEERGISAGSGEAWKTTIISSLLKKEANGDVAEKPVQTNGC
jgi:hypothetical protein